MYSSSLEVPSTPTEALLVGAKRYFPTALCPKGHLSERFTVNRTCVECHRLRMAAKYATDKDTILAGMRASYPKRKPRVQAQQRNYYLEKGREASIARAKRRAAEKPDAVRVHKASYRERNRDLLREKNRRRHADKPALHVANQAARRSRKRRAMPTWVDREAIKAIYALARQATELSGVKCSVDHIVPLKHSLVCGLHVPWNLRLLSLEANKQKGNKFTPGDPT